MKPSTFLGDVARFWALVDRSDGCWIWIGECNNKGYGRFNLWHDNRRTRIMAHRLVLKLTGIALDDAAVVMHECDNPPCVNPTHLRIGTQLENIRDALAKGRLDLHGLELAPTRLAALTPKQRRRLRAGDAA